MEKFEDEEKQKQYPLKAKCCSSSSSSSMWDCGSTLYDSYELNSLKLQLDSAIANSPRSLSMPHLPERRCLSLHPHDHKQPPPPSSRVVNKSSFFNISRTFQKLVRFVLKSAASNKSRVSSCRSSNSFRSTAEESSEKYQKKDRFCVVYDKSESIFLSTIPEHPDFEIGGGGAGLSPDISNFVRKSASERFTATAIGISCS